MHKIWPRASATLLTLLSVVISGPSCAQVNTGTSEPIQGQPLIVTPQIKDPLASWTPSSRQAAALAMIPTDVESQRQELLRIALIPLPSYDERLKMEYLMGSIFPDKHPLRKNKDFLLNYYRSLGKPTQTELDEVVASLKTRMIHLKGGKFTMGDFGPMVTKEKLTLSGESDNPPHAVEMNGYAIMKGRVTYGEYHLYLRDMGRPVLNEKDSVYPIRPGYVVGDVQWADADGYCRWLGQVTGKPFALTTEAQWEYAAREGGKLIAHPMYHWTGMKWQNKYQPVYGEVDRLHRIIQAKAGKSTVYFSPYPPSLNGENRIGMQGVTNTGSREWVADWYDKDYYLVSPKRNPTGPATGTTKVARVGAGEYGETVMDRESADINDPNYYSSFRCALNEPKPWK